jgi:histidine triad (HIT) family protein
LGKIVHATGRIGFAAMPDRDPDCLFCKILAGEIPGTILAEDERTVAFMDITRPRAATPSSSRAGMPPTSGRSTPRTSPRSPGPAQRLARRARETLGADGVNLMNSWARTPGRRSSTSTST